jgi:NADH-quinone oxidoreductase subunit M
MLLAGILLKLGGFGLIRCVQVVDFSSISCYFRGYFFVFLAYRTLVCCWQSDFKRLVAYSSVSHIMVIPLLLLNSSGVGLTGILLVMVFHGLSSPLLFYVVGLVYSFSSTRQLFLLRGISTFSYFLVFILIFSFLFTMCIPPFPSFISEVLFFLNSFSL